MVCVSVALLSVMGTLGKHLGEIVSVVQIVFFRSLFALLPVSLALGRGGFIYARAIIPHIHVLHPCGAALTRVLICSGQIGRTGF